MFILKLLLRNVFLRHKLRSGLTLVGLVVAISAFGLLRTIVDAWYAGVEASSSTRLVSRSAPIVDDYAGSPGQRTTKATA